MPPPQRLLTCEEKAVFKACADVADRYIKNMPERVVFFLTCDVMMLEADRRASAEKLKVAGAALKTAVAVGRAQVADCKAYAMPGAPGNREATAAFEESLAVAQAAELQLAELDRRFPRSA